MAMTDTPDESPRIALIRSLSMELLPWLNQTSEAHGDDIVLDVLMSLYITGVLNLPQPGRDHIRRTIPGILAKALRDPEEYGVYTPIVKQPRH